MEPSTKIVAPPPVVYKILRIIHTILTVLLFLGIFITCVSTFLGGFLVLAFVTNDLGELTFLALKSFLLCLAVIVLPLQLLRMLCKFIIKNL